MAEEQTNKLLDKIEKLIVDGQKDVVDRLIKLENGQDALKAGQDKLRQEFKTMYSGLKNEIVVTGVAVQETVKEEIKRVEMKLDEHCKQPAHV